MQHLYSTVMVLWDLDYDSNFYGKQNRFFNVFHSD